MYKQVNLGAQPVAVGIDCETDKPSQLFLITITLTLISSSSLEALSDKTRKNIRISLIYQSWALVGRVKGQRIEPVSGSCVTFHCTNINTRVTQLYPQAVVGT